MKIKILNDLQEETNRLFIAGAKFAPGDPRISKLVPILAKMGEKSPALKRLSLLADELLSAPQPEVVLAELGVLLNSVLSTQGDTYSENLEKIENTPLFKEWPDSLTPYSTLSPIITALTTTGQARLEVIQKAYANGYINDFRLYPILSKGLADKYKEITLFLVEKVIPSIGSPMVPFLLRDLDINGGKADALRFNLLDTFNYENIMTLAEQAMNDGSKEIQIEAIKTYGRNAANEAFLLELTNDKKSDIKEAALVGLIRMDSAPGKEKMINLLSSPKFKSAIAAAALCKDPEYNSKIFECVKKYYEDKVLPDPDNYTIAGNFAELLQTLLGKNEEYIYEFFIYLFEKYSQSKNKQTQSILVGISNVFYNVKDKAAVLAIFERVSYIQHPLAQLHLDLVKDSYTPKQIYQVFAPFYEAGKLHLTYYLTNFDEAWADLFIKKQNIPGIAAMMDSPAKPRLLKFLKLYVQKREHNLGYAVRLLADQLPTEELAPIAQKLYEAIIDQKTVMDNNTLSGVLQDIFSEKHYVDKLFLETDQYHLLEELKKFLDNLKKPTYVQSNLKDQLARLL